MLGGGGGSNSYLSGRGDTITTKVVFQGLRLIHCTLNVLLPVISPNVGNSTAEFVVVGDCVRAFPDSLVYQ